MDCVKRRHNAKLILIVISQVLSFANSNTHFQSCIIIVTNTRWPYIAEHKFPLCDIACTPFLFLSFVCNLSSMSACNSNVCNIMSRQKRANRFLCFQIISIRNIPRRNAFRNSILITYYIIISGHNNSK